MCGMCGVVCLLVDGWIVQVLFCIMNIYIYVRTPAVLREARLQHHAVVVAARQRCVFVCVGRCVVEGIS